MYGIGAIHSKQQAAIISTAVREGLQPSYMSCTKLAAWTWSLCCLTSVKARIDRLGCDELSGRTFFFQVGYGISALL
jgi:hypothetical protein